MRDSEKPPVVRTVTSDSNNVTSGMHRTYAIHPHHNPEQIDAIFRGENPNHLGQSAEVLGNVNVNVIPHEGSPNS